MNNRPQARCVVYMILVIALLAYGSAAFAADRGAVSKDPYDRSNVPIEVQPTDPKAAKIVLIAGDAGTGHPSGDHEHFAGCALLLRMLQQTPGVAPVMAKDGWPTNPETLKNARTLVFYMDGGGKQTTLAHAAEIQKMMDAGVGIVHIHQVIDYPTESGKQAMQWLGGVYEPKTGARGHWDESFTTFPNHEITRGVTPFTLNDGWILKLRFVPELKGITPLLRTTQLSPKKSDKPITGSDNIVCWAYERADGGRAFVLTGGHGHKNWGLPGLRKLVVNGILWSAKVEIPKDGAAVALDPADLMTNLERKAKPANKAGTTCKATGDAKKSDQEAIQGIWDIVAMEIEGRPVPANPVKESVEFVGNRAYNLKDGKREEENPASFKLDPSQNPPQLDLLPENEKEKGTTFRAIYELSGDQLKICLSATAQAADKRPNSFNAANTAAITMQRRSKLSAVTAPATRPSTQEAKSDAASLQGIWDIVSAEFDGKPLPKEATSSAFEFEGDHAWRLEAEKRTHPSIIKLDPSQAPARIDFLPEKDSENGKTSLAIYELNGDRLKICGGTERPKNFSVDNATVLVLQRRPKVAPKSPAELAEIAKHRKADAEALRGTWDIVSAETDGKPAPKEVLDFAIEFDESHAWHVVDNKRSNAAALMVDASQKPAQIDISPDGAENGPPIHGIYELKGEQLTICMPNNPGAERPKTFTSEGNELMNLKRRVKKDH